MEIITQIKTLIGSAQTEQAIRELLLFLETDRRYDHLHRLTVQVRSEYSRLRADQIGGTLSEEQQTLAYNRINQKLLGILDKIANHDLEDGGTTGSAKAFLRPAVFIAAAVIVASVLFYVFNRGHTTLSKEGSEPLSPSHDTCPPLEVPGGFNVLVANFVKLRGPDARPEVEITREINALCRQYSLKAGATLVETGQITTLGQAERICRDCQTQLVVFGTYETVGTDSLAVNINYKLITDVKLTTLQTEGESGFRSVQTVSGIDAEGELLSGVAYVIKAIFGVIAISQDNVALAAPYLWEAAANNYSKKDTLLHRLSADCFISTNETERALKQYNAYFEKGGDDDVARNNRATINYVKGNNEAVVSDANTVLAHNQTDTTSLLLRSSVYARMQQWDNALDDLVKLQQVKPNDPIVKQKVDEAKSKMQSDTRMLRSVNPMTKIKHQSEGGGQ